MRSAVVDLATNVVVNIIVADAAIDAAPAECVLIDINAIACDIGWLYDPSTHTFADPLAGG